MHIASFDMYSCDAKGIVWIGVSNDKVTHSQSISLVGFSFWFLINQNSLLPLAWFLSVRWIQPTQQQGRFWPSSSSSTVRLIRLLRVCSCLAFSTQQMNSFRAIGVMLSKDLLFLLFSLRPFVGQRVGHEQDHLTKLMYSCVDSNMTKRGSKFRLRICILLQE